MLGRHHCRSVAGKDAALKVPESGLYPAGLERDAVHAAFVHAEGLVHGVAGGGVGDVEGHGVVAGVERQAGVVIGPEEGAFPAPAGEGFEAAIGEEVVAFGDER